MALIFLTVKSTLPQQSNLNLKLHHFLRLISQLQLHSRSTHLIPAKCRCGASWTFSIWWSVMRHVGRCFNYCCTTTAPEAKAVLSLHLLRWSRKERLMVSWWSSMIFPLALHFWLLEVTDRLYHNLTIGWWRWYLLMDQNQTFRPKIGGWRGWLVNDGDCICACVRTWWGRGFALNRSDHQIITFSSLSSDQPCDDQDFQWWSYNSLFWPLSCLFITLPLVSMFDVIWFVFSFDYQCFSFCGK